MRGRCSDGCIIKSDMENEFSTGRKLLLGREETCEEVVDRGRAVKEAVLVL